MDSDGFKKLMKAAIGGKAKEIDDLAEDVLCEKNQQGNSCLHIASMCGNENFYKGVLNQKSRLRAVSLSLLSHTNNDNETPLLIAVKSGRDSLADVLLKEYCTDELKLALLKKDKQGCNVLHHAIRNGYKDLALNLIEKQRELAADSNNDQESPMFIAVLRGFDNVYKKLLEIETSKYTGPNKSNALHAAVKYDEKDFVKELVHKYSERAKTLAREEDTKKDSPIQLVAHFNRVTILHEMLTCDRSLGYHVSNNGNPLLCTAANWGHVAVAEALLEHCPDAPYQNNQGRTCLHEAVEKDRIKFVQFILKKKSKLRKLVNMKDDAGDTALHYAVKKCNPKMVSALLGHPDIDVSVINKLNCAAIWSLSDSANYAKTINWHKICLLILNADHRAKIDISNLHEAMMNEVMDESRKDVRLLIQTYTGNTSLVAILIATITFAAAFTLPGGYSGNAGSEGLPIMAKNLAFQAFLIFDTLAMCSSLAVAFISVITRWADFEFLLHYRFWTKKLMWFAYLATTIAFATGLYTVLASRVHWLAIGICVISVLLPILTMLIGEWPIWKLRIRCPKPALTSSFLDMV